MQDVIKLLAPVMRWAMAVMHHSIESPWRSNAALLQYNKTIRIQAIIDFVHETDEILCNKTSLLVGESEQKLRRKRDYRT